MNISATRLGTAPLPSARTPVAGRLRRRMVLCFWGVVMRWKYRFWVIRFSTPRLWPRILLLLFDPVAFGIWPRLRSGTARGILQKLALRLAMRNRPPGHHNLLPADLDVRAHFQRLQRAGLFSQELKIGAVEAKPPGGSESVETRASPSDTTPSQPSERLCRLSLLALLSSFECCPHLLQSLAQTKPESDHF